MTYHALVNEGRKRLLKAGQGEQAAQLLMVELCSLKDINLYMVMDEEADEQIQTDYLEGIHLMEKGSPLGYVLGYEWFYGYRFTVNGNVLIPRPETEELVALVLGLFDDHFADRDHVNVFDVGTGSGAIAISLSLEEPKMDVIASDISKEALDVAYENNKQLNGRVSFIEGSMLEPFIDRDLHCDLLVCNPPYIPAQEKMEHSVVDYEPHIALFGGEDGLKFYREVFERAHEVCTDHAVMAFEMGWDQGERLRKLALSYFPKATVKVHKDLSGKDRMLSVEL